MSLDEVISGMKERPFREARRPHWKKMACVYWDSRLECFMNRMQTGRVFPCVILAAFQNATDFEWVEG